MITVRQLTSGVYEKISPLILAAALVLTGCSDVAAPGLSPNRKTASESPQGEAARTVARALAVALSDARIRTQLRDAWRDSRESSDHKLFLAGYLTSMSAGNVIAAMARSKGISDEAMVSTIRSLPSMDMYLPVREHRESWKATDDILVAATFNQSADQVEVFDVVGGLHAVSAATVRDGRPLIILHPAEPRYPVYTDEKASTGDVIQLRLGESVPRATAAVKLANVQMPPAGVNLKYFDTFRDDGAFGGDLEMEFRSFGYDAEPGSISEPYWVRNCPWQQPNCGVGYWNYGSSCSLGVGTANLPKNPPLSGLNIPISPGITASTIYAGCGAPTSRHGYWLRVVEMDGGLNGEDDFGTRVSGIFTGKLPYGLTVTTTSGCCSYYYLSGSGEENDNRIVSVFMALQID